MREIAIGTSHTSTLAVTPAHTATALGSGDLSVFGTPAMAALMENAAMQAIAPFLDDSESCVGISLNITHDRATAVGDTVTATATVSGIDGRRVDFKVCAADSAGAVIGQGAHSRFVVDKEKFMAKIEK